jgi:transcriptional regulator with XRE-family HTH domain
MICTDRIKNLCKGRGITIARLEKELGFANGTIASTKSNNMRSDRLMAIANYFGVSMNYLMTGKDWEWEAATPAEIEFFEKNAATPHPLTDQERGLLDIFRHLSNKDELLRYARYLKDGEKEAGKSGIEVG